MKKWIFLLLFLVLAGGGGYYGWIYYEETNQPQIGYKTESLTQGNITVTINATGVVEPEELINVGAQVNGLILSFGIDSNGKTVDYGSRVQEGTILANIDSSLYDAELLQYKAQAAQAQAAIEKAYADSEQCLAKLKLKRNDYFRALKLIKGNVIGQADFEAAASEAEVAQANMRVCVAQIAQAKASLAAAQASLKRASQNLGYCTIISPVKGVVIDRRVNIGQTVVSSMSASSLFLIAKDLSKMQVWVSVNEADIGKIKTGLPVEFTVDAFPDRKFKGVVGKIRLNATLSSNVVIYTVEVQTDNSDGTLLPYLTANVRFIVDQCNGEWSVPNGALRFVPDENQVPLEYISYLDTETSSAHAVVWIFDQGELRPVKVEVLMTDGVKSAVRGDLREGDAVTLGTLYGAEALEGAAGSPFMPKFPKRDKKKSTSRSPH